MDANELHIASYRRHLRALNRSQLTIDDYEDAVKRLGNHYAADVADLSKAQLEDYFGAMLDRGLAATTVGVHFRSLRAFYNWALREEIVDRSPMQGMKAPKATEEPVPVVPDDQVRALLKACSGKTFEDRRDTAIIRIWLEPGSPRLAEMTGVQLGDLDMKHDQIAIHGKGDRVRVVPFGSRTGQALDRYLRMRAKQKTAAKTDALWLSSRGGPLSGSGLSQMLGRRCEQAAVPHVHPHQLRHTAAHLWHDSGGSEQDAMVLFGWKSADMPRRYGKSAGEERARRAARRSSIADRF